MDRGAKEFIIHRTAGGAVREDDPAMKRGEGASPKHARETLGDAQHA
jgi:hypothetical protein